MHPTKLMPYFLAMVLGLGTLAALSAKAASQGSRTPAVTLFEGARLIVGDGSTSPSTVPHSSSTTASLRGLAGRESCSFPLAEFASTLLARR